MPKILPNRTSKTLTDAQITAAKDAIKTLVDIIGTPVAISDDEFKSLAKLGDATKSICDEVLNVVVEAPNYLEEEQPLVEVQKDKTYYEQLTEILAPLYRAVFLYEREQGTAGAEYRNAISNYEGNVKDKVKKGNSIAQLVLDKLNRISRALKPSAPKATKATPTEA